ncbi:non-specific lipid-transfer protein 2P [Eucalyptus grandis]|uniref:Uncharacterized protein n=2 Tax=Eucalyptus grandis TaxID=71139 RepID=A0ACC3J587_EUCGR|nr:non-specific lipid-transfer protein 2P [Eucalyptus grandis]KAK3409393.1 hypothetical protein EUGRSUZ_J01517 [Eucalyptus grandis]
MTRKGPSPLVTSLLVTALILSSQLAPRVEAVCDASRLLPCLPAFGSPYVQPTAECCGRLKEQQPCLCDFMKDPRYRKYVDSPRAKEILQTCQIPYPRC